nr:inverse autotransporter beta domain-containing protein [Enterobacter bugandensis]
MGMDNSQKNLHAITVGIYYTPAPLITLVAEQRQGPSGKSDNRLNLDINWRYRGALR